MPQVTWAEKAVRRIIAAQTKGRLEQKFKMADVRQVFPKCPSWVLHDHRRGNPESRSEWFIQHGPGLYSLAPAAFARISP